MKKLLLLAFAIACLAGHSGFVFAQAKPLPYKDPKLSVDARVKDLLSRMTVEEKVGQLNQLAGGVFTGPALNDPGQRAKMEMVAQGKVGSLLNVIGAAETKSIQEIAVTRTRLGIPLLFALDVIHGYKTIFPIPLAEACSWNVTDIERNSGIAAKEAASAGIHWTFAPMCDISNDPRWGRVMEGAGEDPFLAGEISAARVRGFQGKLNDNEHILACVKHFAAYGAVQAGREYNHVDVSRSALWNLYLPSYEAAVKAGAATVMNSFNVVDGVPASGDKYLVTDILRRNWGFKGVMVSDWASFGEMVTHGYAADEKDAALKAIQAGSEIDMESKVTINHMATLVKEGKVTMKQLDDAAGNVLRQKFILGLFDDPYKFSDPAREAANIFTTEHRNLARQAARNSLVLLKNDGGLLPLPKTMKRIAVVGYLANSKADLFDFWVAQGNSNDAVTILEGIKNAMSLGTGTEVVYASGVNAEGETNDALINEARNVVADADVIIFNMGISGKLAGEERSLANIDIPESQYRLLDELSKFGKPVVALVSSGRPLVLTPLHKKVPAILQCWIPGTEGGNAVADILFGDYAPSAKTVITFPYALGQVPVMYNHYNTGRPVVRGADGAWKSRYRDIPNEPLYPFGYGLTYTTFSYSNLKLNNSSMKATGEVSVTVNVTNTGKREGEEVVQLYIQDVAASIIRPVKELKEFQRVKLAPGETRTVTFLITAKDLSFRNEVGKEVLEPGVFKIFAGGNSRDVIETSLTVE